MKIEATSLPPKEAIAFWQSKTPISAQDYAKLSEEAKARAFFVSGLAKGDMLDAVQNSLGKALAEGQSFATWKKGLAAQFGKEGWVGDNPYRLETIFRNNMQSAYQSGRWQQMQKTVHLRPFLQMSVVNDSRTRPAHAALSGVTYPADDAFWGTYYPPNGHRCRCTVKSLSARQVEKEGITVEKTGSEGVEHLREHPDFGLVNTKPAGGFDRNVGQDWWAGVRDLPTPEKHPEAHDEAKKHPAPAASASTVKPVVSPVKTHDELCREIEKHCGEFMSHGKPIKVTMKNDKSFMSTDCNGQIKISTRKHTWGPPDARITFNAAKELQGAWNALAEQKALTWKQEYAVESLWHEIMHNRQKIGKPLRSRSTPHVLMETANQWQARRSYQELLMKLGGKPAHQTDIFRNGFGYQHWVRNFDALLDRIGVKDEDILGDVRHMLEHKPWHTYDVHLMELLKKQNPAISAGKIQRLFANLSEHPEEYDGLLDKLVKR